MPRNCGMSWNETVQQCEAHASHITHFPPRLRALDAELIFILLSFTY